jgi:hypothetical protein
VRSSVVATLSAIGALFVLVTLYGENNRRELTSSLEAATSRYIGREYRIRNAKLEVWETDLTGEWWITLDSVWGSKEDVARFKGDLGAADESDAAYYRKELGKLLESAVSVDSFEVFRGEAELGRGTICAQRTCNMVMLIQRGGREAVILISRI